MRNILLIAVLTVAFISCEKHDEIIIVKQPQYVYNKTYSLPTAPSALSKNDSSAFGIYKGVVINTQDSLGTFQFNINNNNNQPFGLFYSNSLIKDSLIRYLPNFSDLQSPKNIDTSSINAKNGFSASFFSYHPGPDPTVFFVVNPSGSSAMNVQLYAKPAISAVIKEKSNNQVFCFEGTYSGLDDGKIAFVLSNNIAMNVGTSSKLHVSFKNATEVNVTTGKFVLDGQIPNFGLVVFTGTYNNNMLTGTWISNSNPTVINQFSAKRTL